MKKAILFIIGLPIISAIVNLLFTIIDGNKDTLLKNVSLDLLLIIVSILFFIIGWNNLKKQVAIKSIIFTSLTILLLNTFVGMDQQQVFDSLLPKKEVIGEFVGKPLNELMVFTKEHGIELEYIQDYNDEQPKNYIYNLNVNTKDLVEDTTKIIAHVSMGPDLEKSLIIPDTLGWNVDELLNFIRTNHLQNTTINYVYSDSNVDTVIERTKVGKIRRNESISFTLSRGLEGTLTDVTMIDLTNKDLLEATLFFKKYDISYDLKFDFNDSVERAHVLSQNKEEGSTLLPGNDRVELVVSKGKAVKVVDFTTMSVEDIIDWSMDYNIDIVYNDAYDDSSKRGDVILQSIAKNQSIEEESTITVTISKGPLQMESFSDLQSFKNWATKYNIAYNVVTQFSDSVSSGKIISFSHQKDQVIKNGESITVTLSKGNPISIPSFTSMSISSAQTKCNSLGLRCTFKTGNYDGKVKDSVVSQSIGVNTKVENGTSITLTVSKGTAKTFTLQLQNTWFTPGSSTTTLNTLKRELTKLYPDVYFNYKLQTHNSLQSGLYNPECSNVRMGSSIKQGQTYTLCVVR